MPKEPIPRSSFEFFIATIIALSLAVFPMTWWLRLLLFLVMAAIIIHVINRSPWTIKWSRILKTIVSYILIFGLLAALALFIPETKECIMNVRKYFDSRPPWMVYGILAVIGIILIWGYWGLTGKIFEDSNQNKGVKKSTSDKLPKSKEQPDVRVASIPTAEEIAAEVAKRIPNNRPKKEPTFKEISGPFRVITGSNVSNIHMGVTQARPMCAFKIGDTCVISVYIEQGKLYADTMLLYGNKDLRTVEVKHNMIMGVPPKWDRNFDDNTLEIVDETLDPRLQIIYKTSNTVVINGVFNVNGQIFYVSENGITNYSKKIQRIFKYPSNSYSGIKLNQSILQEKKIEHKRPTFTDKELSMAAIALAKKMRTLESEYKQEESMITNQWTMSSQEQKAAWAKMNKESEKNRNQFAIRFKNNFLGEAVYLRDELRKRLPKEAQEEAERGEFSSKIPLLAFDGILAGPSPVSDAANYLENLARKLSPLLTESK